MQKLGLNQSLQQKLSPQQIQFIKLLQVPTVELAKRIEEELEINPALEDLTMKTSDESSDESNDYDESENYDDDYDSNDEMSFDNYLDDDISGYKMQGDGNYPDDEDKEMPISFELTLFDSLMNQLGFLKLDERELTIGKQIIGSIDNDGYMRRELESIVNDMAFSQGIETDEGEVESILFKIQNFEPAGIAARTLQECLHLQLMRKEEHLEAVHLALEIVDQHFEEFTKKHYEKIQKKTGFSDEEMKEAINLITHLNPKPGGGENGDFVSQYVIPDFLVYENNGKLEITLNSKNAPELRVSRHYIEMFDTYDKSDKKDKQMKEAVSFVKQKLDAAKWFIDAIKQRQNTLLKTMQSIVNHQKEFFLHGEESKLRPMILKDVAEDIQMDISTVSRVVSSKTVQTEFGVFPLKFFFSEGLSTESGEDVSNREIKSLIKELIENEDKSKPLPDDKIEKILHEKGYHIARRTVAKYREQMELPVARLRKKI
ncbi:MAG: RNA polymerase factor sigma-54 [Cytophagales bacterium]